jgi:uncharacterized protein YbjT (DUF2867 family)
MVKPILVAGATGGVGRQVVLKLLAEGIPVRLLVREFKTARSQFSDEVEYISGDVREPTTLIPALDNVRAVVCSIGAKIDNPDGNSINTPERVDYEGVRNLATAARDAEVEHFVLVSWLGVTHASSAVDGAVGDLLTWKQKGEAAVRQSGLLYTIIRPGTLTDDSGGGNALRISQGDKPQFGGEIGREDVATVCVAALRQPAARNVTLEVVAADGDPPIDWGKLFAGLKKD